MNSKLGTSDQQRSPSSLSRRQALFGGALLGTGVFVGTLLAACGAQPAASPQPAPKTDAGAKATAAPAQKPAGGQTITMKFGFATLNDMQHEFANRLKDKVAAQTNGALQIQIYPASQLGDNQRMLEAVQLGTLEANIQPPEFLAAVDPRFPVISLPYLFESAAEMTKAVATPGVLKIANVAEERGIKGMGIFQYGLAGIIGHSPYRTLDDLRGKKIRVLGSPIEIATFAAWGATGVPMPLAEVGPALQQKTVDGVVQGPQTYYTLKYHDMARYFTMTGHYVITSVFIANKKWFDGLPADIQKALSDNTAALQSDMAKWSDDKNNEALEGTKATGKNEVILLTKEQAAPLRERLVPSVWDKYLSDNPSARPLLEGVQAELKKIRGM